MSVSVRYTIYDTWAELYNSTMGVNYAQNQLKTLEKLLLPKLKPNCPILDLCCGTGQLVNLLERRGYKVIGLDGSERMLDYARQNAPNSKFILADARDFNLAYSVAAVCSTSASLNHIMSLEDLKQVFVQVHNVLQNEGFLCFDINHHGQLDKWWNGRLAEGEINNTNAWGIIPHYDSAKRTGSFTVGIYQAPNQSNLNLIQLGKNLIDRVFSLKFLTRFRLKLLRNFATWQPQWSYSEIDYPVRGYTLDEVKLALTEVGFTNISVQTLDGDTSIDNNHSAYFIAQKKG